MLRLIQSSIASIEQQLVLVAPDNAPGADVFNNVTADSFRRQQLIREMQLLRGGIYVEEGNVQRHNLGADGRHRTPEDDKSWHLLIRDDRGQVRSCVLFLLHENATSIRDLRVRDCPMAKRAEWASVLKGAVESEMARAHHDGLRYAEVGGWAIRKERRGTPEGLMMVLATYALARILGGVLGITTANVAHSCTSILRRLGGSSLEFGGLSIPAYFDPKYNTNIELLRFDSRSPRTKYAALIDIVKEKLLSISVIANGSDVQMAERYEGAGSVAQPMFAA